MRRAAVVSMVCLAAAGVESFSVSRVLHGDEVHDASFDGSIYEVKAGATYAWTATKPYARNADSLAMLQVDVTDIEFDFSATASAASATLKQACANATAAYSPGDVASLSVSSAHGSCADLTYDGDIYASTFKVRVDVDGAVDGASVYVAFYSTADSQLRSGAKIVFKDSDGADVLPLVDEAVDSGSDDDDSSNHRRAWQNSMLACLLLLAVTTVGAFVRLPLASRLESSAALTGKIAVFSSAFACGALMACAMFIILFEATHLIGDQWVEEGQATWRFGTMVLVGYAVGLLCALVVPHPHSAPQQHLAVDGGHHHAHGGELEVVKVDVKRGVRKMDVGFVFTIFIGDFMHNFVDGIFIANAFLDCRQAKGWVVTSATVCHELAQEVSDFFLLITQGGLTVPQALAINMASGFSAPIGAAIFLLADPGVGGRGLLLAFSGGVYIYIACTEAAQHVVHSTHASVSDRGLAVFFYVLGAICIGLVLIDDFHCTGDEAEGGGDGHGH
mmetsp:Transcript_24649/g.84366  ORF Transcript_24649/g.84366 Transcript_24649/m.84366 type:complete len:504 (-) Transcript_24649:113-1624(-)